MEVAYLSPYPVAAIPEPHDTLLSPPKLCSVLASIVLEIIPPYLQTMWFSPNIFPFNSYDAISTIHAIWIPKSFDP
jgi:hypothetical protein